MRSVEKKELIISWITISIAFAFFWSDILRLDEFARFLPISFFAVGTGFVFHELAHRTVARHYGCFAEYRMWKEGLLLALILPIISLGHLFFAAPGAVYIYGPHLRRKEHGIISLAGPLTNIIIALLFLFAAGFIEASGFLPTPYLIKLLLSTASLNLWFAFFNLIPLPPLDGSKVFIWNPLVWAVLFFPLLGLFFLI